MGRGVIAMRERYNDRFLKNKKINDFYLTSIVKDFIENMDHDTTYIIGEGKETSAILLHLGIETPTNGIKIIKNGQLVPQQNPHNSEKLTPNAKKMLVVCPRDDGTIFHEVSKEINNIKKENIHILITPIRLEKMRGKPFTAKTKNTRLNKQLSGFYQVTTSYRRKAMYKITNNENNIKCG